MSSARPPRRPQRASSLLLGLQIALLCCLLPLGALAQGAPPADPDTPAAQGDQPPVDEDQKSPYQRHLENGVKLYRLKDYAGALAEFQAAYRAEQKASPLINQALSYRALRDYPRAIAVLEQAVAKHSDTMSERNLAAATREIREMRALLAYVKVQLEPAEAQLFVNGTAQPLGERGVIELSPGKHKLEARAEGYQSKTVTLTVAAGEREEPVKIALEPSSGQVSVIAASDEAWIEVDDKQTKQGLWQGRLSPGVHVIRIKQAGEEPRSVSILVAAGGKYRVSQPEPGGELVTDAKVIEEGQPGGEEEPDIRRGAYGLFGAGFLTALTHPLSFKPAKEKLQGGVAAEAHGGYRVTDWAAFEGLFQFCDLRVEGDINELPTEYKLKSFRFGLMLHFMYPTRTMFRFVGGIGGGLMYEILEWDHKGQDVAITQNLERGGRYLDTKGFGGFAQVEAGLELEISNILFDLVFQNIIQSTKGLDTEAGLNPFETAPWWILGPSIRAGYSLW